MHKDLRENQAREMGLLWALAMPLLAMKSGEMFLDPVYVIILEKSPKINTFSKFGLYLRLTIHQFRFILPDSVTVEISRGSERGHWLSPMIQYL